MSILIVGGAGYVGRSQPAKRVAQAGLDPVLSENLAPGDEGARLDRSKSA